MSSITNTFHFDLTKQLVISHYSAFFLATSRVTVLIISKTVCLLREKDCKRSLIVRACENITRVLRSYFKIAGIKRDRIEVPSTCETKLSLTNMLKEPDLTSKFANQII